VLTADRRLNARFGQALGVANRRVLHTTVAAMDETVPVRMTDEQRLLQGVQGEVGLDAPAHPPTGRELRLHVNVKGNP
jgi:hypothetical protein